VAEKGRVKKSPECKVDRLKPLAGVSSRKKLEPGSVQEDGGNSQKKKAKHQSVRQKRRPKSREAQGPQWGQPKRIPHQRTLSRECAVRNLKVAV